MSNCSCSLLPDFAEKLHDLLKSGADRDPEIVKQVHIFVANFPVHSQVSDLACVNFLFDVL